MVCKASRWGNTFNFQGFTGPIIYKNDFTYKFLILHKLYKARLFKGLLHENFCKFLFESFSAMEWSSIARIKTNWFVKEPCLCAYKYSRYNIAPVHFPPFLDELTKVVSHITGISGLNSVNVNLYDNHKNSLGWHTDDEPIFGSVYHPIDIVSLSLGSCRTFSIKHNTTGWQEDVPLENGDILTMEGLFQKFHKHRIPEADNQSVGPRINLTWRVIKEHTIDCPLHES